MKIKVNEDILSDQRSYYIKYSPVTSFPNLLLPKVERCQEEILESERLKKND